MLAKISFPLAALHYNLKRLLVVRLIVFACQVIALCYAYFILSLSLNYFFLGLTLAVFAAINLALALRLKKNRVISEIEFLSHLLCDVLFLCLLLYLSGGANNPFVSYLLVPVTISAAILPWSYTWMIAGISLFSYSVLLFFYQPLPELMPMEMMSQIEMSTPSMIPNLHIIGMWFNFLVSAVLITYFVVKMAAEIRTQQEKISGYKEDNMRDEQILAVATQAAGTAHELGTPLSTMAVLLNDLQQENIDKPDLHKDLVLLKRQVDLCKKSLQELVRQADFRQGGGLKRVTLAVFISQVLDQWQLLRPEIPLQIEWQQQNDTPEIRFESTLQQAIVNMLNNAADASPSGIEVSVSWDDQQWILNIHDYGEGIASEISDKIGLSIISTKDTGMGVGLILSQASINRLGGSVSLFRHQEQGTVTKIIMPFEPTLDKALR